MRFDVFYAKNIFDYMLPDRRAELTTLAKTHVHVRTLEADSIGSVYNLMQVERWHEVTPEYIERLGLSHTSMSAGDIVRDEQGNYWQCLMRGWQQLE